ncbi:MAG: SRPBCC family protein [Actinobacteria bacterium]|nr:SRPBCC family protein [Actinomycetota bacterium]
MTVVTVAVEVEASPEKVWAVISDAHNLPKWSRFIGAVEGVPRDGLSKGAEYTTVMRFMAVKARVHSEVLEWDPPTHAVFRLSGLLDAIVTTTVKPLSGDRSRLEHEIDYHFHGHALGELTARSLRALGGAHFVLKHGIMAQKRHIEGG